MAATHTVSTGNVFVDLGLSQPEEWLVKSKLAAILQHSISELNLTQTAAAHRMGMTQPKLSKILRGRFDGISDAYIAEGLLKLGHDLEIRVISRHQGSGKMRVLAEV
jgi:predicted XRE-type DNA-binding protein